MIAPPPASLAPPAPFPPIVAQSSQSEFVAPGIMRATYRLMTPNGPLVVHAVRIDPHEPTVRFGVVTANDRLVGSGETLSSMALRTGALAGVNTDYFDIGGTYQPLNIVVIDGALVRSPSKRIALEILRNRSIRFTTVAFSGTVTSAAGSVTLTSVNQWPPEGGAGFLTPRYGVLRAAPEVSLAQLAPLGDVAATGLDGTYRVVAVAPATSANALSGPALAYGPAALRATTLPRPGDTVTVGASLDPALDDVAFATGGGPLLVANGATADDPNAPAPEERDVRFPVSGAALDASGALTLLAVDGRQPSLSIGLTRPEFAALMLGFNATDAMAFDSGGSAEVVARTLGDAQPSVQNSPSDGEERRIADGLFAYSDAPAGGPARLVVRPSGFGAFAGSRVPLAGVLVDASGRRVRAIGVDALTIAAQSGDHATTVHATSGTYSATLSYRTVTKAARLALDPERPNPAPGTNVVETLRAFDETGAPIVIGDEDVRWNAGPGVLAKRSAQITVPAGAHDFELRATLGVPSLSIATRVLVGSRDLPLAFFAPQTQAAWHFAAAPLNAPGALAFDAASAGTLDLSYDFRDGERAAYANAQFLLPGDPRNFAADVDGDGSGAGLRAAFVNRFGERRALTLAKAIDWRGWRRVAVDLPPDLNPPVTLVSLYVVPSLGAGVARGNGIIRFRSLSVRAAGTP